MMIVKIDRLVEQSEAEVRKNETKKSKSAFTMQDDKKRLFRFCALHNTARTVIPVKKSHKENILSILRYDSLKI